MRFQLDFTAGAPVYQQLVDQVKTAAAAGTLRAGDPLPPIRPLAEELRINRNTVAKAYAELEREGVIETLAGKGCFVRDGISPLRKDVRRRLLADKLDAAAVHARHLQIGRDEFMQLAAERFDALETRRLRSLGTGHHS